MNFFDHKDLGNHLLQLCPEVVKHSVSACSMLDAGEFNTKDVWDVLKLTLCLLTAIVINELEILRYDCLPVREEASLWINFAVS